MKRISELERKYVLQVLDNEFHSSKNNIFNARLEKQFSDVFRRRYAIGHVNGTATMHTALMALGVKSGDEVIVPPLTMSSPALAVLQNGSVPVFADVDRKTFCVSPEGIQKVITEKTKAIITVSLYGLSPDYDEIKHLCQKHGIYLIEDNAECFLGKYKGRYVGEFGHFSSYSFQASKHMTCGEGGMLITDDEELANRARRFSSLGYAGIDSKKGKINRKDIQDPQFDRHISLGFNYRMSELCAAVALAQLERLNELVDNRIKVSELYDEIIQGTELLTKQYVPKGFENSYWTYAANLNVKKPEIEWYRFRESFLSQGGDGFYAAWKLTYMEPYFKKVVEKMPSVWQKYEKGLCPNAEFLQPRMIQLKTDYWELSEAEAQAIVLDKTIKNFKVSTG